MGLSALVVTAACLLNAATPEPTDPWKPGYRVPKARVHLPLEAAARPTTLPRDQFAVRFESRVTNTTREMWRVPIEAGAGYGVFDDLEVGLRLLRLRLTSADDSDEGGLEAPTAYVAGRVVFGRLELGALLDIELPLEGFRATDLVGFGRFHLGTIAHIDIRAQGGVRLEDATTWPGQVPAEVLVNVNPRLAFGGGIRVEWLDLGRFDQVTIRPTAKMSYTIGEVTNSPLWQLEAFFEGAPNTEARSMEDIDQVSFGLRLVLFFDDPSDNNSGYEIF